MALSTSTELVRRPEHVLIRVLLGLALCCLATGCDHDVQEGTCARQGVLDLRNWDFERQGPVLCAGEWECAWNTFLAPADADSVTTWKVVTTPETWMGREWQGATPPAIGHDHATASTHL